jgi:uncharacterized protein (DUF2164 family)
MERKLGQAYYNLGIYDKAYAQFKVIQVTPTVLIFKVCSRFDGTFRRR